MINAPRTAPRAISAWKPPYLRQPVLLLNVACIVLEILGLILVSVYSKQDQGFVPPSDRYRPLWKYGLTAGVQNYRRK